MTFSSKLNKIQALIDRTSSEGERQAAALAKDRILNKERQSLKEIHISLQSIWQKSLFLALCKKYRLETYRYLRQKHTSTVVMVEPNFLNDRLWPEYLEYSALFQDHVLNAAGMVIEKIKNGVTPISDVNLCPSSNYVDEFLSAEIVKKFDRF